MASDLKTKLAERAAAPAKQGQKTVFDLVNSMKGEIARALPKHIDPDRIARIAITALRSNSNLQACNPASFLGALMQASQLGLEPNTPLGQAYLIPYGKEVQFQLGYRGLMDLARRSGEFHSIYAHEVHEQDEFVYRYGLHKDLIHVPATGDRGAVTYYYAVYHLKDGGFDFIVMSRTDIEQHARKYSKAFGRGPWQTDFDAMGKKTVLKQLLKYAPVSIEVHRQVTTDETVKTDISDDMTDVIDITDAIDITETAEQPAEGAVE